MANVQDTHAAFRLRVGHQEVDLKRAIQPSMKQKPHWSTNIGGFGASKQRSGMTLNDPIVSRTP